MLTRRSEQPSGVTLLEMIVAMTVAGIVLALVAAISTRQQRLYADMAVRGALASQLRQGIALLPIELRGVASAAGDIREARDTSIEFREGVASAIICDTSAAGLVLAPAVAGESTFASYLTSIAAGDTVWVLTPTDSGEEWAGRAAIGATSVAPGDCAPSGPRLSVSARARSRVAVQVTTPLPDHSIGRVLRVTRPVRYSLYRGGDGRWYLGQRDWNVSTLRFNTIQPVSGPFSSAAAHGLVFEYFDSAGAALAVPVADTRVIGRIRISLRGQSRSAMRAFSRGPQGKSLDSAVTIVSLRNRR